jgi:hypothetical protein
MTKNDYILLAAALAAALTDAETHVERDPGLDDNTIAVQVGTQLAVQRIADALQRDNARFDRDRFLAAVQAEVTR